MDAPGSRATASPRSPAGGRLTTLDALRGLCVFALIEQHVGIWLWEGPAPGLDRLDYPALVAFNAGSAIGAPMFYALSGLGTALMCAHSTRDDLDAVLVRRGLVLYGFGMVVNLLKSGPLGGDQQLGAMIAEGRLDVLIFFIDPLSAQPHDVDVKALTRLATLYDVPCANNKSTADAVLAYL